MQLACSQPALLQDRAQYLHQFVLHAALDAVDEQVWITSSMHLGVVDKFNNLQVGSANALSPKCPSSKNSLAAKKHGLLNEALHRFDSMQVHDPKTALCLPRTVGTAPSCP